MLDIKFLKENKNVATKGIKNKGCTVNLSNVINSYDKMLVLQKEVEELRANLNIISKKIKKGADKQLIKEAKIIKLRIQKKEPQYVKAKEEFDSLMSQIPNIPSDDTPIGTDESANKVLRTYGEKKTYSFTPRPHWEIAEELDIIDKKSAAKISGSRFAFIKNELTLLQFGIIQYTFEILTNEQVIKKIIKKNNLNVSSKTFIPVLPPSIARKETYQAMARLQPEEDKYKLEGDEEQYLAGSAEHTLGALHINQTFQENDLPLRYAGYSTCFRKEAGTYGKDTRGIYRMHQFDKIEMETFTVKENGLEEHKFLVAIQEHLLQGLELHYQVVAISTGDMGSPDYKQVDMETWMPGQDRYGETHSADYVTDYQPRRLKTYVTRTDGKKELVHMNDATAFAIGRLLIAIIEQNQTADGSVTIPKALRKYTNGIKSIKR